MVSESETEEEILFESAKSEKGDDEELKPGSTNGNASVSIRTNRSRVPNGKNLLPALPAPGSTQNTPQTNT